MSTFKNLFTKVFQGLFEYLLVLPILLLLGINIFNDAQLWSWLVGLFLLFVVGVTLRIIFANQKWWLFSVLAMIIGTFSSFIFEDRILLMIVLAMIYTLIVYRGMMYGSQTWQELLPISFLWIGSLGVYFVSYVIFWFAEGLNPYLNVITVFGTILIVMTMFVSNSDHLKNTTLSKDKKPLISRTIKIQNRIFLIITIAIIALITNGKAIRDGIWNAFRAVVKWLIEFMSGSGGEEIIEEPPPPAPMELVFPFEEPKEPSAIAKFFEMITMYAMYVFLVVAAIVLILLLIKKSRIWIVNAFRLTIQFLKKMMNQITERDETTQYVEEKESVFDWQEWKDEQQSKARGFVQNIFKRKPSWHSLSNQQKVRFVFKNFLLQEIDIVKLRNNATPREILEHLKLSADVDDAQIEQLRMAYEQTRYGEQDIDEQIINEIYELIE